MKDVEPPTDAVPKSTEYRHQHTALPFRDCRVVIVHNVAYGGTRRPCSKWFNDVVVFAERDFISRAAPITCSVAHSLDIWPAKIAVGFKDVEFVKILLTMFA